MPVGACGVLVTDTAAAASVMHCVFVVICCIQVDRCRKLMRQRMRQFRNCSTISVREHYLNFIHVCAYLRLHVREGIKDDA